MGDALFYLKWAELELDNGYSERAKAVLNSAIANKATPLLELKNALSKLQTRKLSQDNKENLPLMVCT